MIDSAKETPSGAKPAGERVEPVRFGGATQELYGCHHPPMSRSGKKTGVLLCQPYGPEYLRSHRAIRQLASRFARAGYPVFRFDYFACGDSIGADDEGRIPRWTIDVSSAVAELKSHARVDRVFAVGLRLGGSLAAMASADRGGLDGLVLWDPVVNGKVHVDDLLARHRKQLEFLPTESAILSAAVETGENEILGFDAGAELLSSIGEVDLLSLRRSPARRMLIIESTSSPSSGELASHLKSLGTQLDEQHLPDHEIWMAAPDKSVVPGQILQSIVAWISGNAT